MDNERAEKTPKRHPRKLFPPFMSLIVSFDFPISTFQACITSSEDSQDAVEASLVIVEARAFQRTRYSTSSTGNGRSEVSGSFSVSKPYFRASALCRKSPFEGRSRYHFEDGQEDVCRLCERAPTSKLQKPTLLKNLLKSCLRAFTCFNVCL